MEKRASVVVSRAADRQIDAMERWRRDNRLAASTVRDEIASLAEHLAVNPHLGNTVEGARRPGLRHFYLERSGYHVFYRVDDRKALVTIVALRHERQRPVRL